MSFLCSCPPATALTEIPAHTCDENMGQIVKVMFQRRQSALPFVTATNDITELASWTAFKSASDDTKIVGTSDRGANATIEAGTPVTFGGDNSAPYGLTLVTDGLPSTFAFDLLSPTSAQIDALQKLVCEGENLSVYLINNSGQIICKTDGTDYGGLNVESVFVGDAGTTGYGSFDMVNVTFQMPYGWSTDRAIIDASDFDPRYDL